MEIICYALFARRIFGGNEFWFNRSASSSLQWHNYRTVITNVIPQKYVYWVSYKKIHKNLVCNELPLIFHDISIMKWTGVSCVISFFALLLTREMSEPHYLSTTQTWQGTVLLMKYQGQVLFGPTYQRPQDVPHIPIVPKTFLEDWKGYMCCFIVYCLLQPHRFYVSLQSDSLILIICTSPNCSWKNGWKDILD